MNVGDDPGMIYVDKGGDGLRIVSISRYTPQSVPIIRRIYAKTNKEIY